MSRYVLLIAVVFFGCSNESSSDLENKLKELTQQNLVNSLKSPNSYKAGKFRFATLSQAKTYPHLIDSLYKDSLYNTYFWVDHIYLAQNSFGAEIKGMVRAEYDSRLRLIYFSERSDKDERKYVRKMAENGYDLEPLQWE